MSGEDFRKLFDRYFDEIRRYLYYRGGDAALAEDITQQTFMKLWEKQTIILPGKERALLYKMAANEFIDQVRREKLKIDFTREFTLQEMQDTPESELEIKELEKAIQQALNQMKENQRVVFLMSRTEGLKYSEIANRLGISIKAVEKRMTAAIKFLNERLRS